MATPIGHLGDISLRALETLRAVGHVAVEDTRVSARLFAEYGITKPMLSTREHNEQASASRILGWLADGEDVALITDAGTPGISDPGARVVRAARDAGFRVSPVPGASALIAALSCAGLEEGPWVFAGFLPARSHARRNTLGEYAALPYPLVFYESPHRIRDSLTDMADVLGPGRTLTVARELTKVFEQFATLPLGEALAWLDQDANRERGEFVLVVSGAPTRTEAADADRLLRLLMEELPASRAARVAAQLTGHRRAALYDRALELQGESP